MKRPPDPDRLGPHGRDLTGMVVNELVAKHYIRTLRQGSERKLQMNLWECHCRVCGAIEVKQRRSIVDGSARCSRCYAKSSKIRDDLTGRRFGRLTVTGNGPSTDRGESRWFCDCDCGNKGLMVRRSELINGDTTSCGCKRVESTRRNQRIGTRMRLAAKKAAEESP